MPLDVRVKAIIMENERKTVVHGRSAQLSEGGMGVTMTREMPKGTVATLIFKLPGDEDERTLLAEVKYRSGFRCGFEFRRDFPADAEGIAPLLYAGSTLAGMSRKARCISCACMRFGCHPERSEGSMHSNPASHGLLRSLRFAQNDTSKAYCANFW